MVLLFLNNVGKYALKTVSILDKKHYRQIVLKETVSRDEYIFKSLTINRYFLCMR
jgi:hypothetical protein